MHTSGTGAAGDDEAILRDLHDAVERLADAVADQPPVAAAIRRFGRGLPRAAAPPFAKPPHPRPAVPVCDLLYYALDEGAIDPRRFDYLMLVENRAARALARRRRAPAAAGARAVTRSGRGTADGSGGSTG